MILIRHIYPQPEQPEAGVYFVKPADTGFVRLGYTENVLRRIAQHQSSNVDHLRWHVILRPTSIHDETCLHRLLEPWRVIGTHSWYANEKALWKEVMSFARQHDLTLVMLGKPQTELPFAA